MQYAQMDFIFIYFFNFYKKYYWVISEKSYFKDSMKYIMIGNVIKVM